MNIEIKKSMEAKPGKSSHPIFNYAWCCVANPTIGIQGIPNEMEDDCNDVSTCKLHWTQLCSAAVGPEPVPVHEAELTYRTVWKHDFSSNTRSGGTSSYQE